MFDDTRPAELDAQGGNDAWAEFRVTHTHERAALLRQLRDGSVPVILNAPDGASITTSLWALDSSQGRLNFCADLGHPMLGRLVDADDAVAVAYLESVKLQFDLPGLVLVRSLSAASLQTGMPREIYRFQRRGAYRVRAIERHSPQAMFRHPSMPDMALALRVLDVSVGGCALWLPQDVPPLQAGTLLADVLVELDTETRFNAAFTLQHVTVPAAGEAGVRLGCEWRPLSGGAERCLQRWIDQAQKRRRLLSL
ncbi:MAG: flagellar brake protein [Chitinophagaceae bacterium]|nr:flagellar brake protein [Rubrivivax sp.]